MAAGAHVEHDFERRIQVEDGGDAVAKLESETEADANEEPEASQANRAALGTIFLNNIYINMQQTGPLTQKVYKPLPKDNEKLNLLE